MLIGQTHQGQPVMLTEFGGIALSADPERTWGYSRSASAEEFGQKYERLLRAVRRSPVLAGICYTQFTDTYQESNGLLYADRTPKVPLEQIALATRGSRSERDTQDEFYWREQLMSSMLNAYAVPGEDRTTRSEQRP